MIRNATPADIGALVRLTSALAASAKMPIAVDPAWTAAWLARHLGADRTLALVIERDGAVVGMLIAGIGQSSVSPASIAIEHGWYCEPEARGWGLRLLAAYRLWARAQGCAFARLSLPEGADAAPLARFGFRPVETALVEVI